MTTDNEVWKQPRQSIDSLTATKKTSQIPSKTKTTKKTVYTILGTSVMSKTSSQGQRELLFAKHRREELDRQHEGALQLAKLKQEIELQIIQQKQHQLHLEKEHIHQDRNRRLQKEEQQLQFQEHCLLREKRLEVLELEEEATRRIAEVKIVEIQLTDDQPESNEEIDLEDTLSQLSTANRGAESQKVTDWVHGGSVENSNQSQLNVADADPSACAFLHPTPMNTSFLVNSQGVKISNKNLDNLTHEPTPLFQQQSCVAGISLSILALTSGFDNTAIAPPPFDASLVKLRRFVKKAFPFTFKPCRCTLFQLHNRSRP